jgi:hypothetical protein
MRSLSQYVKELLPPTPKVELKNNCDVNGIEPLFLPFRTSLI